MPNTRITLKNVKFYEALSEETNAFTADVYLDGKKFGYAKNSGQGGCTFINQYPEKSKQFKEAEAYAETLEPIVYEFGTYPTKLEDVVDGLFEEWLTAKEKVKNENKLKRNMEKSILVGKPDGKAYMSYGYKGTKLSQLNEGQLRGLIVHAQNKCNKGELILNTNLKKYGIDLELSK